MLAPSGQSESPRLCPLLEQQRTTHRLVAKSANDQSGRTSARNTALYGYLPLGAYKMGQLFNGEFLITNNIFDQIAD